MLVLTTKFALLLVICQRAGERNFVKGKMEQSGPFNFEFNFLSFLLIQFCIHYVGGTRTSLYYIFQMHKLSFFVYFFAKFWCFIFVVL